MIRTFRAAFIVALLAVPFLISLPASAQVPTGTPPFGSFGGGPDIINLANLNSHITVPVFHKPGRGTNFTYDLSYDSSVWYPVTTSGTTTWQPVPNWGWRAITEVVTGYVNYTSTFVGTCYDPDLRRTYYLYNETFYYYHDSFGVAHNLGPMTVQSYSTCSGGGSTTATRTLSDGSGSRVTVSSSGPSATVTKTDGTIITPPLQQGTGAGSFTDRNGNKLTANTSGQFFDTLSSTSPVLTVTGTGTPSSPLKFSYAAPSASPFYTMNYTTLTVRTNFGCGITEYGANGTTTANLVTEIDLPDTSKYIFTYETTPGDTHTPHHVTGRLASVTLPTGGTITYTYTGGSGGNITCSDGSAPGLTRALSDGAGWSATWQYDRAAGTGAAYTTTVSDPSTPTANQTVIQFQGLYETQRIVNQGSSPPLGTVNTCYNGSASPCTSTAITLPLSQISTILILPGANSLQSKTVRTLNGYGLTTELDEYDFGSGAPPSTPLRKTLTSYASLGNGIVSMPAVMTVKDGSNNVKAQTTFTYDQGTPVAPSGTTPQHVAVSGSRGNATTIASLVQGSTTLNQTSTYYDTGVVRTLTDVNGAVTTNNLSDATSTCGNAFPTSVSEPLSMSKSFAWNCNGGVLTSLTDENSKVTTATYNDPYFWRPSGVADPLTNVTSLTYSSSNPRGITQSLTFNGNQSIAYIGTGFDGLGRAIEQSHLQAPGATSWDQVTQSYDSNGRPWKTSAPCVTTGAWTCPVTAQTTTYDALNRPLQTTDAGGGTTTYSYSGNDVLVTVGPAPTGENTKRRQMEYDGLGRLTSVCEITSASGSGSCGQNSAQTGFWTKYAYDTLGNLTGVTQNAQGTAQTRSYGYDFLSRLTSETNPESGTTTYIYDTMGASSCNSAYTSNGDLIRTVDANGTNSCYYYDSLHRLTDIGTNRGSFDSCKRFRYDNTNGVLGSKPSGVSVSNGLGRLVEAETDTCAWPITQSSIVTDEWFSYTARGEVSDLYESTLHSGGYYHTAATYWANGAVNLLTAAGGYSAAYNLDGEGRVYSTAPSVGALNATVYNAASQPTQITFASLDSDTFTYDPNTNRMTQYKFNVNGQSVIGNLTWNPVGTLASLAITDPFNSANAQTCNYSHDDLTRIASANCGSAANQTFNYDAFGNINKSGSPNSFQATYSTATNRMTSIGGSTPSYDANGNVLNDFLHSYAWDAYGRSITIDGVSVTYDALGRMVEQNRSGAYSEIVYAPDGTKIEIMNGQSFTKAFVPLPGGAVAVYVPGIVYYRHPDHLGSSRFASKSNRTMYFDGAYAPFGEPYAQTGTTDLSFTGQNQDTVSNLYDFPAREYGIQGRWASPDPAGLAAANLTDPQSWNRFSYVRNRPLNFVDPSGLNECAPGEHDCNVGIDEGMPGSDVFGNVDPIGCGWSDFWGGDCAVQNRMFAGFFARADINLLPGNRCFETIGDYICTNTVNGDFWYYTGRGGIGSGKYYLKATSDCGNGGDREIQYDLVQQTNGQIAPAMNFTVQEHIQVLSGTLFSFGAPQGPNSVGQSGYDDYISGTGTRNTWQTFTATPQGGPQISVFARNVYGRDYGTNGIFVQGAQGSQPAQIFVNAAPTPPGTACVFPSY